MSPRSMAGRSQGRSAPSHDTKSSRWAGAKRGGSIVAASELGRGATAQIHHSHATSTAAKIVARAGA